MGKYLDRLASVVIIAGMLCELYATFVGFH
jgi:hypothetical protein